MSARGRKTKIGAYALSIMSRVDVSLAVEVHLMFRGRQSIYIFLGLGLVLAIGAITAIAGVAAQNADERSLVTQKTVVQYETQHLLSAFADKMTTMVYWQEAYDKIATGWNAKWVGYQFGPYLDAININVVVIFNAHGQALFSYTHGLGKALPQAHIAADKNVRELLAATLQQHSVRPPIIQKATIDLDGTPFLAVSGLITPETDSQMPIPAEKKRIVMFLTRLSAASYATLSEGFGVTNIKVTSRIQDTSGLVSVPLKDPAGDVATSVWWHPMRPGLDLLKLFIPLIIVVFLVLAAVQALIVRRWQLLQRALHKAEAKAESAEEESRAKSAFLGTISHELRTPLNAILGFSDILVHKTFGDLGSPRYEEYAGYIRAGGLALLRKINDLIEIARIETHDTAIERIQTDAGELARDAMEALHDAARQKNITLTFSAGSQTSWCEAAPLSLRQVLIRILDNAIKFSPVGETIEIGMTQIHNAVAIEIRDHGIGIGNDHLSRLGKPFVQVEGHLVRQNEGIGLGLAISMGLMKLMGGRLDVASTLGIGTTITLRLPAVPAPRAALQNAA